jgi:hypothetical protein
VGKSNNWKGTRGMTNRTAKKLIKVGEELCELLECLIVTLADDETNSSPIQNYFDRDHDSDMWPESKV